MMRTTAQQNDALRCAALRCVALQDFALSNGTCAICQRLKFFFFSLRDFNLSLFFFFQPLPPHHQRFLSPPPPHRQRCCQRFPSLPPPPQKVASENKTLLKTEHFVKYLNPTITLLLLLRSSSPSDVPHWSLNCTCSYIVNVLNHIPVSPTLSTGYGPTVIRYPSHHQHCTTTHPSSITIVHSMHQLPFAHVQHRSNTQTHGDILHTPQLKPGTHPLMAINCCGKRKGDGLKLEACGAHFESKSQCITVIKPRPTLAPAESHHSSADPASL